MSEPSVELGRQERSLQLRTVGWLILWFNEINIILIFLSIYLDFLILFLCSRYFPPCIFVTTGSFLQIYSSNRRYPYPSENKKMRDLVELCAYFSCYGKDVIWVEHWPQTYRFFELRTLTNFLPMIKNL